MCGLKFVQCAMMTLTALLFLAGCVSRQRYNALESRYQELASEVGDNQMQIARLQDAIKATVNDELRFPAGSWQMPVKARQTLATLVPILASMQQTGIMVNGYSDNGSIGPKLMRRGINSNLVLSRRRADSVMHFLISQGVNPSMVIARGFGDADQVAANDTAAGRAQNRRVELILAGPGDEMLADPLPPTTIVVSPPAGSLSPSPVSSQSRPATDAKPSIIWHQVDGRWHWHCAAHCSKFRSRHESPG
jgi:chemotaxis protein MotB